MDQERYAKKCAHCGEPLKARDKVCPRCGADAAETRDPKTLYELRTYCAGRNMPLEKMRFFLGEDCQEPRAFGIYQDDDGDFVVYKNKADGTRAVRYKGPDEAHAVDEIYRKLLSEIEIRKQKKRAQSGRTPTRSRGTDRKSALLGLILTVLIGAVIGIFSIYLSVRGPHRGYYYYDDGYYYSQSGDWYYFDEDAWIPWDADETLRDDYPDYYVGDTYESGFGATDFYYSGYYEADDSDSDWDDDWDDDSDWDDWDDWDTDWDSDW